MKIDETISKFSFLSDVAVVGGAVRDMLLGRESDDIDLATSDKPHVVKRKCNDRDIRTIDTGIEHGTVTAVLDGGQEFEITTFRRDVSTDGRNATVEFAQNIREDLKRRDFTINAMASQWQEGKGSVLIDPFGGIEDLINERIRAVGDPNRRFREDFLRIVRMFRFARRFGFDIGAEEMGAAGEMSKKVEENVSVERVVMEIEKAMKDDRPDAFLEDLMKTEILSDFLDSVVHRLETEPIRKAKSVEDRMIVFLIQLHGGTLLDWKEIQDRLRISNERIDLARKLGLLFEIFDTPVSEKNKAKVLAPHREVLEDAKRIGLEAFDIPLSRFHTTRKLEPVVSGQDFLDEGFEEGPQIGELVDQAHRIQLEEEITDKETLIERAKR